MNTPGGNNLRLSSALKQYRVQRGLLFGLLIVAALLAFEVFNYSTTDYALSDLLGDLRFAGIAWSTILAIAFCGIDFAGIARLFTPEDGGSETTEVWYLFGAWMLAATMNALLTWWGVSLAIANHSSSSAAVMDRATLLKVVPIFVAIMVWVIRVLIIGTFSVAGDRLFTQGNTRTHASRPSVFNRSAATTRRSEQPSTVSARPAANLSSRPAVQSSFRPAPRTASQEQANRPEPTYHPASMSGKSSNSQRREL